jgi:SAM-dependent methyltransferase
MKDIGQNPLVWTEAWSKSGVETGIRMWDYYGGRQWILKYAPRYGKVLEAGCGLGRYNFYLSHFGIEIIGLDFSEYSISLLKSWQIPNGYSIPFIVGDVKNLPFKETELSGYISLGVIEHFIEGPTAPLLEAARVLRPGGIAIITTPNHTWSKSLIRFKVRMKQLLTQLLGGGPQGRDFFQYEYSPKQLKKFIENSGLRITVSTGADFLFTFSEFGKRCVDYQVRLPWYFRLAQRIDNSFLSFLGAQSISISVKAADTMHCFLCDDLSATMKSLDTYTVPVCENCSSLEIAQFYSKSATTQFHNDYQIILR